MKKNPHSALACFLLLTFLFFTHCKKDNSSTITLHDKSLSAIQSHIHGKWKLEYAQGGFCGTCTYPVENYFWEFNGDHIKQTYKDTLVTDATIIWRRDKDMYGDSTFLMTLGSMYYIVDGIYNDTLVLRDNASDPMSYHFSKSVRSF